MSSSDAMRSEMAGRVLILGASGQLGRRTAEHVLAQQPADNVILVTRTPDALGGFAQRGCSVRFGDLDDPGSLGSALAGAERMLLISGPDVQRRAEQHTAGVRGAALAGVRHVVYTSGLRPEPPNPAMISESHQATERALAQSGLAWTVLRESLYSEYQVPEAAAALRSGALAHNRGAGRIAYVSRDDCAAAAAAVLSSPGHEGVAYDITGPELLDASQLAALYAELGGREIALEELDDGAFAALVAGDAGEDDHARYGASLVASLGRSIREGYMSACTDAVQKLTGHPPRSLRDVLSADRSWREPDD
ncbi:MAG: NAD(P)H-binding protein [Solirubrobacteraceae bacterium]